MTPNIFQTGFNLWEPTENIKLNKEEKHGLLQTKHIIGRVRDRRGDTGINYT